MKTLCLIFCYGWIVFFNQSFAYQYELAIASIFQNEGPFLEEWIEYHRMVGVEHFWLYNDASTDNWRSALQPYIDQGIVEVVDWPSYGFKNHIQNQINAMQDAHRKAQGTSKWLALIDADEYILPMRNRTITRCLEHYFQSADAVYITWKHFGTNKRYLQNHESMLFALTACSKKSHPRNRVGKTILRPDRTYVEALWTIHHCVSPDVMYYDDDAKPMVHNGVRLNLRDNPKNTYLRINHYTLRDEQYFHNIRLPRARGIGISEELVWEHYRAFNKTQDYEILRFIQKKHPDRYRTYWKFRIRKNLSLRINST